MKKLMNVLALQEMQKAKAAVEAFEAGAPSVIDPSIVSDPFNPQLMESNAVLSAEKERLTAEMMAFVVKDGIAPMQFIDVMRVLTVRSFLLVFFQLFCPQSKWRCVLSIRRS